MKIAILLAFAAYLGVSLAANIEEIQDTSGEGGTSVDEETLVKKLIAIYEKMSRPPVDDSSRIASDASSEALFGSMEAGKYGKLTTRMEEDIAEIEAVFKARVAPSYDGMSGRKLWKELMKKQKNLVTSKVQLQHLLNAKQEKLNKLHGKPSKQNIPSTELIDAILSQIDEVVAYRPVNLTL